MKLNYLDEEEYFVYFEEKYTDPQFIEKYPLIAQRMEFLCESIKEKIYNYKSPNFFRLHAEILGLDAQLQIILMLVDTEKSELEFSEELILKCSKEDYPVFMKEFCGSDANEFANHSLYFSVI